MSLKPKRTKTKAKKRSSNNRTFAQNSALLKAKKAGMMKKLNTEFKGSFEVSNIEAVKEKGHYDGNTRIRVIAHVNNESDVLIAESFIYREVAKTFGQIGAVWEPGIVDQGWEFNYFVR